MDQLPPSIFSTAHWCLHGHTMQEGLSGLRDRRLPRIGLFLHFTPYPSPRNIQEKLQLWMSCINYFTHGIQHIKPIFSSNFSGPANCRQATIQKLLFVKCKGSIIKIKCCFPIFYYWRQYFFLEIPAWNSFVLFYHFMLNPSVVLMDFHVSIFPLLCVMLLLKHWGPFAPDLL